MNKPRFAKLFFFGLMAGAVPALASAAETANAEAKTAEVKADAPAASATQYWRDFGWLVSQGIVALDMNETERAEFIRGVEAGLTGQPGPGEGFDERRLNEFLEQRFIDATAKKNAAFFTELAKNPNVKKTDSGLYYEIIKPGNDVRATGADKVRVHYKGALTDGNVFDDSFARGEPVTFPVNGVVTGFGEGIGLVGEGGEIKLYIPSELAYGLNPPMGSGIPPNATLVFDVNVEAVIPQVAAPAGK